jgi:hypothetical protein
MTELALAFPMPKDDKTTSHGSHSVCILHIVLNCLLIDMTSVIHKSYICNCLVLTNSYIIPCHRVYHHISFYAIIWPSHAIVCTIMYHHISSYAIIWPSHAIVCTTMYHHISSYAIIWPSHAIVCTIMYHHVPLCTLIVYTIIHGGFLLSRRRLCQHRMFLLTFR